MENTPNLTAGFDPILAQQIAQTRPGMAHWAASGPFGATCGQCAFHGYWRQFRNRAGDTKTQFRKECCGQYRKMTSQHGDRVPGNTEACRYFQKRGT
jgi:hypothetical protein